MFKPIVLMHLILATAYTVFVVHFYDDIYGDEVCMKLTQCKMTVVNETHTGDLTPYCPVKHCSGQEACCRYCQLDPGQSLVDEAVLTSNIKLPNALTAVLTQLGLCVFLFVMVNLANLSRVALRMGEEKLWCVSSFAGFTLILITVDVIVVVTLCACSLLIDLSYYKQCQSDGLVICGWALTSLLILIDFVFRVWSRLVTKAKRNKWRAKMRMERDAEDAVELMVDDAEGRRMNRTNNGCNVMGAITSKIIDVLGGLMFLFWVGAVVYVVGIGEGYWKL